MAQRKKQKGVLGIKITKGDVPQDDWSTIHKFAVSLERGRFTEYIELLQDPKKLLWKSFVSGVGKGFGAIIGATLVVALVVGLLALLGDVLPGQIGEFFRGTGDKIENVQP